MLAGTRPAAGTLRSEQGTSIPRYVDHGYANLTESERGTLKGLFAEAADPKRFLLGNNKDITEPRKALEKPSPAALDQFLKKLGDEELKALAGSAILFGGGLLNWVGATAFDRQRLLDQLLSKSSPGRLARVKALFPWARPDGSAKGDVARTDGAQPVDSGK